MSLKITKVLIHQLLSIILKYARIITCNYCFFFAMFNRRFI